MEKDSLLALAVQIELLLFLFLFDVEPVGFFLVRFLHPTLA